MKKKEELCHCGEPIYWHIEGYPQPFTRGLCEYCDMMRCDVWPGACDE